MKHKITGCILGLIVTGSAFAQTNVTIYGVADIGVEYLSNAARIGTSNNSLLRVTSGNLSGSRWGLRGTEDLGGGLSAIFNLENGFDLDTGALGQNGRLFGRNAYIGLSNTWGTLSFGRHQTALYDFSLRYDPFGISTRYSTFTHDSLMAGRDDNSLKYIGRFGDITTTAIYSLGRNADGELAGNPRVSRAFGFGVDYAAGPFGIGLAYDQYQGNTMATQNQTAKRTAIGANYKLGQAKAFIGYRKLVDDIVPAGTPVIRSDFYWGGLAYSVTPALVVTGAVYRTDFKNRGADPTTFVLAADYSLSKRTDLYTTLGYVRNKAESNLGLNGFGSAIIAGENQQGLVVGVRHRF